MNIIYFYILSTFLILSYVLRSRWMDIFFFNYAYILGNKLYNKYRFPPLSLYIICSVRISSGF